MFMKAFNRGMLLLLFFIVDVSAQEEILPDVNRGFFRMGATIQSWAGDGYGESMNQITFPVSLVVPFSERFYVTITHTPAMSWWRPGFKLNGLSDTWVQGAWIMWEEKLLLNLGVGVPTGKTRLTNPEFLISKDWLSRNSLRFRLPAYGQGLCGRLGLVLAFPLADWLIVGMGGQYLHRRPYHPVYFTYTVGDEERVDDREYTAGDEASAHFGIDIRLGDHMKLMLDGIYTHYWRDLQDGIEVYGPGDKINVNVGWFYRFDGHYLWSRLIYRQRSKNEVLQGFVLQEEDEKTTGDQLELDLIIKVISLEQGGLFLLGDGRYEGKTEASPLNDLVFGLGLGIEYSFTQHVMVDFHLKYLFGRYRPTLTADELVDLAGIEAVLGLQFGF